MITLKRFDEFHYSIIQNQLIYGISNLTSLKLKFLLYYLLGEWNVGIALNKTMNLKIFDSYMI